MGNIGTAVAAYSAPAIAAFYGWQWAFWVFIIPLIAMAAIFWIFGRDAPSTGPRPSVTAGIGLFRQEAMPWVLSLFYFLTFGGFVAMGIYLPKLLVDCSRCGSSSCRDRRRRRSGSNRTRRIPRQEDP